MIARLLIFSQNAPYIVRNRMKLYAGFSARGLSEEVFAKMLAQLPVHTKHSELIKLDAMRSVAWD
jgi:hypothetical protein